MIGRPHALRWPGALPRLHEIELRGFAKLRVCARVFPVIMSERPLMDGTARCAFSISELVGARALP